MLFYCDMADSIILDLSVSFNTFCIFQFSPPPTPHTKKLNAQYDRCQIYFKFAPRIYLEGKE